MKPVRGQSCTTVLWESSIHNRRWRRPIEDEPATITAFIVQVSMGDQRHGSIGYQSIFAAGLTLFLMTLGFNIVGHMLRKRFREAY